MTRKRTTIHQASFACLPRVALLLSVLSATAPPSAMGADIAESGMRLYGALVAQACTFPEGEEEISLHFGTIVDRYLYLNTRTLGHSFAITLTHCDLSVSKTVKVTFRGTESAALPGLLRVSVGSKNTGIAIGLETGQARPVRINQATDPFPLQTGTTQIALKAYVQGEPGAIANRTIQRGPFSASATLHLEYP